MSDTGESVSPVQNAALQLFLAKSVVRTVLVVIFALAVALGGQIYLSPNHTPDSGLLSMLSLAIGYIFGNYGQVYNFSFGSSPQSKTKDQTIASLAAKVPDAPTEEAK